MLKVTYSEVQEALKKGFISPLNSSELKPEAKLINALSSFLGASKPRTSAVHLDALMSEQSIIPWTGKFSRISAKQNLMINYLINEIRHRHDLSGAAKNSMSLGGNHGAQ